MGKWVKGKDNFVWRCVSRRSIFSRRLYVVALAAFALFFLPLPRFPASPFTPLFASSFTSDFGATVDGRLAVFDDAWQTIRERYYDPSLHGVDWQAQRARFRGRARDAANSQELYATLRRMVSSLHDPHTRVFAPDEKYDWQRPRFISVGISLREIGGAAVVSEVAHDSEAERAGVRAGDLVTSIDGEQTFGVFARRLNELNILPSDASPMIAAARLRAMATVFEGAEGSTVKVGWIGVDGRERWAVLRRQWRERGTQMRVRRIAGGTFSVVLDAFTQTTAVDFVRALASGKLRGARALILDLRDNGGGEAEAMAEIASAFLPPGKSLGHFTDRAGRLFIEPHTRAAMLFAPDRIEPFRGPLVILTSERTSSAAEIFVAAMRAERRATIIGANTCGCVLAIRRSHVLPDGGQLDISEMDYRTSAGTRLEGAGIAPDEEITLDRKDIRARRDRAMQRAIQILKNPSSKK